MRNLAEKRHYDWSKAIRKRKLCREWGLEYYDNLHQYSKGKIHCSCPMCRAKTNNRRQFGWYGTVKGQNWSMPDRKRIEEMDYEEQELDSEENF